jgi:hypothetical protein
VDYRAEVWCDGHLVASHTGGQTPFWADVTDVLGPGAEAHVLVVRAEDRPTDVEQPRGKQDWRTSPHDVWYDRTTGIWQPVWVESVPAQRVVDLAWEVDVPAATVHAEVDLARFPDRPVILDVTLRLADDILAEQSITLRRDRNYFPIAVVALRNGQDRKPLEWSPENPVLVDAELRLRDRDSGAELDSVTSYLGIRTVTAGGGSLQINGRPTYLRSVLDQGYRPRTLLASAGDEELRGEVEMIKRLGFNAVRVHQKAEDPRFLYWADRLGLLVWGETAAAYEWSAAAAEMLVREWLELVRRDRSHPCIVAWVPINESWGVQDIAERPPQQRFVRAIADLTRAVDPTRPVISNEGWEHVDSDIFGVHDYTTDPGQLRRRYATPEAARAAMTATFGPAGRRLILGDTQRRALDDPQPPLMITEFGGISLTSEGEAWGYDTVAAEDYAERLCQLFDAVRASADVAGFCYTQFMDTGQETNGLLLADGEPKLSVDLIRQIVTGRTGSDRRKDAADMSDDAGQAASHAASNAALAPDNPEAAADPSD